MPDALPFTYQFWLLSGSIAIGPFTVAEIHSKLAIKDTTWQTLAPPVGGGKWLPLEKVSGIGAASFLCVSPA